MKTAAFQSSGSHSEFFWMSHLKSHNIEALHHSPPPKEKAEMRHRHFLSSQRIFGDLSFKSDLLKYSDWNFCFLPDHSRTPQVSWMSSYRLSIRKDFCFLYNVLLSSHMYCHATQLSQIPRIQTHSYYHMSIFITFVPLLIMFLQGKR